LSFESVGKAYKFKTRSNDDVLIGDPADSKFHPNVTLNRWGGECFLKFLFDDAKITGKITSLLEGNKVKWSTPLFDFHFYPDETKELGGLEFEIILKQKPPTNVWSFQIQTQSLVFYYQPPLTPQEAGCIRPENVVGSYAVYHATRTNMHRNLADAQKYKTGKAFHIYRPKLTDALGKTAWADLNISDGTLTITLPQDFLDSAIYPVIVDPTFGYTTIGASSYDSYTDRILGSAFTISEDGTADSITVAIKGSASNPAFNVKCGTYEDTVNPPFVDGTEQVSITVTATYAWKTFNFNTPKPDFTNATAYILCVWPDYPIYGCQIAYDTGDTNQGHWKNQAYDGWPDPCSFSHNTNKYSIYCTYTTGGGPTLVEVTDTMGLSDTVLVDKTLTINDSFNLQDAIGKDATIEVQDAISLPEQVLRDKTFSVEDVVSLADAVYCDKTVTVSDSIALNDVVEVLTEVLKEVVDTMSLSDDVSIDKTLIVTDTVALNDQILRDKSFMVIDGVQLTDSVLVDKLLAVLDTLQLTDEVVLIGIWPGVYMLLNLKTRTLRLAVSDRQQLLQLVKRKLHLKVSE
jgi:hypothetical protein